MPPIGFESTIAAGERRAATGTGHILSSRFNYEIMLDFVVAVMNLLDSINSRAMNCVWRQEKYIHRDLFVQSKNEINIGNIYQWQSNIK
jgi:hypothetical protein